MENYTAIVPSLNPDLKLLNTVKSLIAEGFSDIVVINDGSSEEYEDTFSLIEGMDGCTLLRHEKNMGKGRALKTALAHLLERGETEGVVTLDGDGQHLAKDVAAVVRLSAQNPDALVLGSRDFLSEHSDMPLKSRFGNRTTSLVLKLSTGIDLRDTQTGLRAISAKHIKDLLSIAGERYEYEMNMLLELHSAGIPFIEKEIETVYEDQNKGSHFHVFRDSLLIYGFIFKFILSSLISFLVDIAAFYLLHRFVFIFLNGAAQILASTLSARLVSSFFNFNLNRKHVFKKEKNYKQSLLRYFILAALILLLSAGCVSILALLFKAEKSFARTLIKTVVDTVLFIMSYRVQRNWVFKEEKEK